MARIPRPEYDLAARKFAELALAGEEKSVEEVANELGIDPKKLEYRYYAKDFRAKINRYIQQFLKDPAYQGSLKGALQITGEIERELKDFATKHIDEFVKAFNVLLEIRDSGRPADEVRRKAAVNIIEFFMNIRSKTEAKMEAKFKSKLPAELQREVELILEKQVGG
jgi:hypothetical protein